MASEIDCFYLRFIAAQKALPVDGAFIFSRSGVGL
ncbi:Uncharacterised protein [Klebsiella michiganensis]|uniref:Uncharacterized protein n=1 Tax=Klebsiella michiganensis TaxID=1134687 RepID=A0A7H4N143_9ENTR|nr:Uncharacterised protein [Klebsiella michiganensis]